jgi:hypothetical protein
MSYAQLQLNTQEPIALVYEEVVADCPSCGETAPFEYCGTQQFPARAAALANLPATLYLFTCCACGSTLSHIDLDMDGG